MDLHLCCCVITVLSLGWTLSSSQSLSAENNTQCDLYYMEQPTPQITCNPYEGVSKVRLRCTIYRNGSLEDYTIKWYRRNVTEGNFPVPEPDLLKSISVPDTDLLTQELLFDNHNVSLLPGDYWCQVGLEDKENSSYALSESLRLEPEGVYEAYPPCNNAYISQQNSMCASNDNAMPTPDGCSSGNHSSIQLALAVATAISAFFLVVSILLFCTICCLRRSRNKKGRGEESVYVHTSNGGEARVPQEESALQTNYENYDGMSTNNTNSPQRDIDSSYSYENVNEPTTVATTADGVIRNNSYLPIASMVLLHSQHQAESARNGQTLYHSLNPDTENDKSEYTDRRKPPPISSKKPRLKPQSFSSKTSLATNKLAVSVDDPLSTSAKQREKPLPIPKGKGLKMKGALGGADPLSSVGSDLSAAQYQSLSGTNTLPVYTSPSDTPFSPASPPAEENDYDYAD